jgi:general secretion pathway protein G
MAVAIAWVAIVSCVACKGQKALDDAKIKSAQVQLAALQSALDTYYTRNGRYPTPAEGLIALEQGDLIQSGGTKADPWGQPWIYAAGSENESARVISVGPDGKQGTSDDLASVP